MSYMEIELRLLNDVRGIPIWSRNEFNVYILIIIVQGLELMILVYTGPQM